MKRSTLVVVVLIIVALGVGGLFALSSRSDDPPEQETESTTTQQETTDTGTQTQNPDTSTDNSSQSASTDEVEIEDMAFQPANITVKAGMTVTWTNKDDVQHDVTPDDGDSTAFEGSELLSRDESYSFTFNTPGTYTYHCGPHPQMTGTVVVTE